MEIKVANILNKIKESGTLIQVDDRNWWDYFVKQGHNKETMETVISSQSNSLDDMLYLYAFTEDNETVWLSLEDMDTIIDSCQIISEDMYLSNFFDMLEKYSTLLEEYAA